MNILDLDAHYIVLLLLVVAFSLIFFIHLQLSKARRNKQHTISIFLQNSEYTTPNIQDAYASSIKYLLAQAIADAQLASKSINLTQARLETIETRLNHLEYLLADPTTQQHEKYFTHSPDISKEMPDPDSFLITKCN